MEPKDRPPKGSEHLALQENFGGFMLRQFLNLRKRLLIRQLMIPAAWVAASAHAELGILDQVLLPNFNPASYEMLFQQQIKFDAETFQNVMASRGHNKEMANRLWSLSPSDIMALNFTTSRQEIASAEQMAAYGISSQNSQKAQLFLKMLKAIKSKNPGFMSDEKMAALAALLADGKTPKGDMFIDAKLLAAVQASAESFAKADSAESVAKAMVDFHKSIGELQSQASSEVASLLSSTHSALGEFLENPETSFDVAALDSEEVPSADSPELQFDSLNKGDLFSDLNLQNEFMIEGDEANKLASNSWIKPTNVDQVVNSASDANGPAAQNSVAKSEPQEVSSQGSDSDLVNTQSGQSVASAAPVSSPRAEAPQQREQQIKQRLNNITHEMQKSRGPSAPTGLQNSALLNAAHKPENPYTGVSQTVGPPKADTSYVEELGRLEASNLGITEPAKVDDFVNQYVSDNAVPETPLSHESPHSNNSSNVPFVNQPSDNTPEETCALFASPSGMNDLTYSFFKRFRLEQEECAPSTGEATPSTTIKSCYRVRSTDQITETDLSGLPEGQILDQINSEKSGSSLATLFGKFSDRIKQKLKQQGACPSSKIPLHLTKKELTQLSDAYSEVLFEVLAEKNVIPLDSKGCPKLENAQGTGVNREAIEALSNFTQYVASQDAKSRLLVQAGDMEAVTFCSSDTIGNMDSMKDTYFGRLAASCKQAFSTAATKLAQQLSVIRTGDSSSRSISDTEDCLKKRIAVSSLKAAGVHAAAEPVNAIPLEEINTPKAVHTESQGALN